MKKLIGVLTLFLVTFAIYLLGIHYALQGRDFLFSLEGPTYVGLSVVSILTWLAVFMYSDSKNKLPWLFIIALFPVVGVILYLIFGNNFRESFRYKRRVKQLGENYLIPMTDHLDEKVQTSLSDLSQHLIRLNCTTSRNDVSYRTNSRILTNGDQKFPVLMSQIKQAKKFIFVEYYIFKADGIGLELIDLLIERALAGVEVYFLFDALGSFRRIKKKHVRRMREAGIAVAAFDPVWLPFFNSKMNHRNHRKMVVIDGRIAITGGINVGDEYIHKSKKYGFWRDTSILVEGEAVRDLSGIFAGDWFFATGQKLVWDGFYPELPAAGDGGIQIVDSGPDSTLAGIKEALFRMIMGARESVYLITPYLIPDIDFLSALKNAALSGLDVRILIPGKADKDLVYLATESYFEGLLAAGVRIYKYHKVFCHAKVVVVDESIASLGTTNMDIRSFYLNFEVNVMLYHASAIQTLLNDFNVDFSRAHEIKYEEWRQRSSGRRLAQSLAQLFSPIM